MGPLPENSVVRLEHDGGFEQVVMNHPTNTFGRIGAYLMVALIASTAGYFWLTSLLSFFDDTWRFDDAAALIFTTLVLGFGFFLARTILRSPLPERIIVVGDGLILDSGADPFRASHLEKNSQKRQSEQLVKPRSRVHIPRAEFTNVAMADVPYPNRVYVETDDRRYDIGEALTPEQRVWLYDYLTERLERNASPVSLELKALLETVKEEQKHKPIITDLHSVHRVDPLDFEDPIAQKTDWHHLSTTTANFRTHELVMSQGKTAFKATVGARAFALTFVMAGLLALLLSYREFQANGMEVNFESIFIMLFALVFSGSGFFLVRDAHTPITFNLRKRTFRRGWPPATVVKLADVHGLQLLSFVPGRGTVHSPGTGYEMNLLMADTTRIHVLCHGDSMKMQFDARKLATMLGLRLFNGIRGHGYSHSNRLPPRNPEEKTAGQLLAVFPAIVFGAIFIWMLMTPLPRDEPVPVVKTAQPRGEVVTFDELFNHLQTLDEPLRKHHLYDTLLYAPVYKKTTPEQRLLVCIGAAEFYSQYEGVDSAEVVALLEEAREIINRHPELETSRQRVSAAYKIILQGPVRQPLVQTTRRDFQLVIPPRAIQAEQQRPQASEFRSETTSVPKASETTLSTQVSEDVSQRIRDIAAQDIVIDDVNVVGKQISIQGQAPNNPAIATLMRTLNEEFTNSELLMVRTLQREGVEVSEFYITVEP